MKRFLLAVFVVFGVLSAKEYSNPYGEPFTLDVRLFVGYDYENEDEWINFHLAVPILSWLTLKSEYETDRMQASHGFYSAYNNTHSHNTFSTHTNIVSLGAEIHFKLFEK